MKLLFNYSDFYKFPHNVCFSTLRLLLKDNFDGVYKDTNGKLIAVFDYHETEREQRIIRSASSFLEIYGYDLKRHTEIVDSIEHLEFVTKTCGVDYE
ncbi:MAG: hypothetical protein PHR29_05140 [Acholeplasmataceae bacterium]|nr:hypothetical protein [Acholeplasmataceae bacterium]